MNRFDVLAENLSLAKKNKVILQEISCAIPSKSLTVIIGPNGAGKSSLLRCLAGLENEYSGEISIRHKNLRGYSHQERTRLLAWSPAQYQLAFSFSALEVVCMSLFPWHAGYPTKKDYAMASQALEKVGIKDVLQDVNSLSSGEQRKVNIARIFASQSTILFFDEPHAHLDIACSFRTFEQLKELSREGKTVCVSSHDLNFAKLYADHIVLVNKGQIVAEGPTDTIFNSSLIEEIFHVIMTSVKVAGREIFYFHPQVHAQNLSGDLFSGT